MYLGFNSSLADLEPSKSGDLARMRGWNKGCPVTESWEGTRLYFSGFAFRSTIDGYYSTLFCSLLQTEPLFCFDINVI